MHTIHVTTRALTEESADALLAKHHVASMAISFHDRVTIVLVNYVYADRWVYGRLEGGPDLSLVRHNQWVALAVNEIAGVYDWRTVTVHGSVQLLSADPSSPDAASFRAALGRLRSAVPAVFTSHDPMPQRVQLFQLYADELVGSEASSDAAASLPRG